MIPPNASPIADAPTPSERHRPVTRSGTFAASHTGLETTASASQGKSAAPSRGGQFGHDLVTLARPVLSLVPAMKATPQVPDPLALRASLAHAIRAFDETARASGVPVAQVLAARYVLCTLVDEVASRTPWGGGGVWGRHSLLAMFHHETEGGERVFQLMTRLTQRPAENDDLLMLIHVVLALGFRGRLGVIDGGMVRLAAVRERLATVIRRARGASSPLLRAQPVTSAVRRHLSPADSSPGRRPAWLAILALFVAATTFAIAAQAWLDRRAVALEQRIASLRLPLPAQVVQNPAPSTLAAIDELPTPWIEHLDADRASDRLTMRVMSHGAAITVHGDGLFESGSAKLHLARQALLGRVAQAMAAVPGMVTISGHTDDQKVRSGPFLSNQALSEARALAVRDLLIAHGVDARRLVVRGAGDEEPIASNDKPQSRAKNRRVELVWQRPEGV